MVTDTLDITNEPQRSATCLGRDDQRGKSLTVSEGYHLPEYDVFLGTKRLTVPSCGVDVAREDLCPMLFDFQRDLVHWALRKGRAALFAYPGLGKTPMQLAWAQHAGERVLILAPLAVAQQTVREGEKFGIPVVYARSMAQATGQITITNYEMLGHFDPTAFDAVVLDESSILKSYSGVTRTALIDAFGQTPMRLCCTATPSPNDVAELANHAEFLGLISRPEMLATFFVHDEDGWRLKGHAVQPFYQWLASWGMTIRTPSDLDYDDDGYNLPPLNIRSVVVPTEYAPRGQMFATALKGVGDRAEVRRATLDSRVAAAVDLVDREPSEKWLLWCGLNAEQAALTAALAGRCVSIDGSTPLDDRVAMEASWRLGDVQVLITKPSVFGWGMNWQHCARMAFVGLSDSYEQYFQTIRRCYRFGQERPVNVWIVLTDLEQGIHENVLRKEHEAIQTGAELVKYVAAFERAEIAEAGARITYRAAVPMELPTWL